MGCRRTTPGGRGSRERRLTDDDRYLGPVICRLARPKASAMSVDASQCVSYRVGHHPHWIQAKLSRDSPGQLGRATCLGDGWVTIELFDGREIRRWCHDDDRLGELLVTTGLAQMRSEGAVQLRSHGVLVSPDGFGLLVSVAEQPTPCVVPHEEDLPQSGRLVQRLPPGTASSVGMW